MSIEDEGNIRVASRELLISSTLGSGLMLAYVHHCHLKPETAREPWKGDVIRFYFHQGGGVG